MTNSCIITWFKVDIETNKLIFIGRPIISIFEHIKSNFVNELN